MIDLDMNSVATVVGSLGGAFVLVQWRLSKAEKDNDTQWKYLHEVRDWQHAHITEALNKRIEYEKRFGEIINSMGKVEIQYIEAEKRTRQIESKIDELARKLDKLIERWPK